MASYIHVDQEANLENQKKLKKIDSNLKSYLKDPINFDPSNSSSDIKIWSYAFSSKAREVPYICGVLKFLGFHWDEGSNSKMNLLH
jgi:hypothetical protein